MIVYNLTKPNICLCNIGSGQKIKLQKKACFPLESKPHLPTGFRDFLPHEKGLGPNTETNV